MNCPKCGSTDTAPMSYVPVGEGFDDPRNRAAIIRIWKCINCDHIWSEKSFRWVMA